MTRPRSYVSETNRPSTSEDVRQSYVSPPKRNPRRFPADIMTVEEAEALIGQCSMVSTTGIRNRALLTIMWRSGIRVGEALSLTMPNLNMHDRSMRVLHGKGDKARTAYWRSSADDALARWIDRRWTLRVPRGAPVFCTTQGGQMADAYVRGLVRRLASECGITKRIHPHIFRHTFAFECEQAGMNITAIASLLGHERISTTHTYLNHLSNADAGKALAALDEPLDDL